MLRFPAATSLALHFGNESLDLGGFIPVPLPLLWGRPDEVLLEGSGERRQIGAFETLENEAGLAGVAVCPIENGIEAASHAVYESLFRLLDDEGQRAHRLWHYVPDINGNTAEDLENYRVFNVGRRRAFDDYFGTRAESLMPAASAVGSSGRDLIVAFLGGKAEPTFLENPLQTPAYHYPNTYGPKTPSFARAARVGQQVYVSGTASIVGHETQHAGDVRKQFEVTFQNLETLVKAVGMNSWGDVSCLPGYRLKVYLRHATDLHKIQPQLESVLAATPDNATVLQADICRGDLDLEIEASFQLP